MFSLFTGQMMYDAWIYQFFNLLYAALPIIIYALFDEEYPSKQSNYLEFKKKFPSPLETNPLLYKLGFESQLFNSLQFWQWILSGTLHGLGLVYYS